MKSYKGVSNAVVEPTGATCKLILNTDDRSIMSQQSRLVANFTMNDIEMLISRHQVGTATSEQSQITWTAVYGGFNYVICEVLLHWFNCFMNTNFNMLQVFFWVKQLWSNGWILPLMLFLNILCGNYRNLSDNCGVFLFFFIKQNR